MPVLDGASRVVKKGDEPLHGTSLSAERGIVTVYDENEEPVGTFAIPGHLSMLAVFQHNDPFHGDVFQEDGFVYRNGKRVRKWFIGRQDGASITGFRVWEPHLNNAVWIETLAERVRASERRRWARIFEIVKEIHDNGGEAHAEALHNAQEGDSETFWLYKTRFHDIGLGKGKQLTYSFQWVKAPKARILPKLGSRLYHLDHTLGSRRRLSVERILHEALQRKLPKLTKDMNGVIERVRINGREYHFRIESTYSGYPERRLLAGAEDVKSVRDLGSEVSEGGGS
jgi:hypothetical protein